MSSSRAFLAVDLTPELAFPGVDGSVAGEFEVEGDFTGPRIIES